MNKLGLQVRVSRPRVMGALAITPEVAQFEIDRLVAPSAAAFLRPDADVSVIPGGWDQCAVKAS